jgi:hypothetical protein
MNRLRAVILGATALIALSSPAAEVTRVASSFEDKDPFGIFIDFGFERTQRRMLISRESHENGDVVHHKELRYTGVDTRLNMDLHIGIYKDFEFHFGLPLIFGQDETWWFAAGNTEATSTIVNNCLQANGELLDPSCPTTGAGSRSLFPITGPAPAQAFRGGFGNMRFGLSYAFFNQKVDDTKPTWVVGFEYEAPTAEVLDPALATTTETRGRVGDKIHKYQFSTALSRRMGIADPYFKIHYTLPYRGPGWYSNCDDADATRMSHPENCGTTAWTRVETGIQPPHRTGVLFGTEVEIFNQPEKHQKIGLDIRGIAEYTSAGRYYNELSGVFYKLLYSGDYMAFGGGLTVNALASEFVSIRAAGSLLYNTDHYLTDESLGKDLDENGTIDYVPRPEGNPEMNPNFDYRIDAPSRRFRASEINVFRIDVTATFTF